MEKKECEGKRELDWIDIGILGKSAKTAPSSPKESETMNNRYCKKGTENSSLILEEDLTSADGSVAYDTSNSFNNKLKLRLNESVITEFEKLTES